MKARELKNKTNNNNNYNKTKAVVLNSNTTKNQSFSVKRSGGCCGR